MRRSDIGSLRAPEWESDTRAVLLPVGSLEQHGPHLPMGTDTLIAKAVCERAAAREPALVLVPAVEWGASHHHHGLPGGAVSIGPLGLTHLLLALLEELLIKLQRTVVVVNGHGGNWSAITLALDEMGSRRGTLPVSACCWWDLVAEEIREVIPQDEPGVGHAGFVETCAVLAIDPGLVAMEEVPPSSPSTDAVPPGNSYQWVDFATALADGVHGKPDFASAEIGNRLLDAAAARTVELAKFTMGPRV